MDQAQTIINTEVEANLLQGGGKFRCIIRDKVSVSANRTNVTRYLVEVTQPNPNQYKGQVLTIKPVEVTAFRRTS